MTGGPGILPGTSLLSQTTHGQVSQQLCSLPILLGMTKLPAPGTWVQLASQTMALS